MIYKKRFFEVRVPFVFLVVLGLLLVPLTASGNKQHMKGKWKKHMKLVGYNDLQGRESLQVTTKGDWVFVGHHPGEHYNPMTDDVEFNGTTIIDISDPANPRTVVHLKNDQRTNSRSASVVFDYKDTGRDYLIRNHEVSGTVWKFEIFDITDTLTNDAYPVHVANITTGSSGQALTRAHKGWWSPNSGLYYATISEPGWLSGGHLAIWDLNDPTNPTFVGEFGLFGQRVGDDPSNNINMHHPIVDEANGRVYACYLTGGDVVSINIEDPYNPTLAWHIDTDPPGSGTHTVAVIQYDAVPNFEEDALPRLYALVADEATGGDMWRFTDDPPGVRDPVRDKMYIFDVTDADEMGVPFPVETWQVPNGDYLMRGGRFGPHQFNETINGEFNTFEDKIAYITYFNAGVRAIDISDPYNIKEVGFYVPRENDRTGFIGGGQPYPNIQINDVDVDYRGLIYASDRVGSGLFVLEFKGK